MNHPDRNIGNPVPMQGPSEERAQQVRDCGESMGMRALTAVEMQQIELKHRYELEANFRSFIAFPTLENFQRIQTGSSAYITAWMNGRRRILD